MADVSKLDINGSEYDIKDAVARAMSDDVAEAKEAAANAQAAAEGAASVAEKAQSAADSAQSAAANAQSTANSASAAADSAQKTADEALSAVNSLQNNKYLWSGYLRVQGSSYQQAYAYTETGFEFKDGAMLLLYIPSQWNGYYNTGKIYVNDSSDSYSLYTYLNSSRYGSFSGFSAGDVALLVYDAEYGSFEVRQTLSSIVGS